MLEAFFSILIFFLLTISLIQSFKIISLLLLKNDEIKNAILVIPISGHDEQAEFILKDAIFKSKFLKEFSNKLIVCLDLNMDKETRQICNIISSKYNFVYVLTPEEFTSTIKK